VYSTVPKNKVAFALYHRIRRAILRGETFRVYVCIPTFPAGNVNEITTRYIIKWVYKTINRKKTSLLQLLAAEFPHVALDEYISFYSLRTWDRTDACVGDEYLTEQVYIHSKLMIVDDLVAIIGSANINDRSMRGSRDSELSVVIQDKLLVPNDMNGVSVLVGKAVLALRLRLWRSHLGLKAGEPDSLISDPVAARTYHGIWRHLADTNTSIYCDCFVGIPENSRRLADYLHKAQPRDGARLSDLAQSIKGLVVRFPNEFLIDETNSRTIFHKEYFIDTNVFV